MSYDAASDSVVVEDTVKGLRFPSAVGARPRRAAPRAPRALLTRARGRAGKDSIIRFDPASPAPTGLNALLSEGGFEQLAAALRLGALSPATECINSRAAMIGFLGVFLNEIATGRSAWSQIGHGGFFSAIFLLGAVSAASVAPLLTCVAGTTMRAQADVLKRAHFLTLQACVAALPGAPCPSRSCSPAVRARAGCAVVREHAR